MSVDPPRADQFEDGSDVPPGISEKAFFRVERLDDYLNLAVVGLLTALAVGILVYACVDFARALPMTLSGIVGSPPGDMGSGTEDPFIRQCLEFLSNVLFAVIVLELLQSILTYVRSHSAQAVVRDFLVVALVSVVRKILLTEAHASLKSQTGEEFVHESLGTLLNVVAIAMLVGGLTLWRRASGPQTAGRPAPAPVSLGRGDDPGKRRDSPT